MPWGASCCAHPSAAGVYGEIGNGRPTLQEVTDKGSNATFTRQDRGQAYLLRRIARDQPEQNPVLMVEQMRVNRAYQSTPEPADPEG